jgi:Transglycosylase/N-acetylmuramoyl-L-alanine amidase
MHQNRGSTVSARLHTYAILLLRIENCERRKLALRPPAHYPTCPCSATVRLPAALLGGHMRLIQSGASAFAFVVEVVEHDLVVRSVVATWFGGPNDPSDSGQTASGISTRQDPKLLGCALPMDGFRFHKTDGSPIPRLPWGTEVRVTNKASGQSASFPLIDLGPSRYAASRAAIDLTEEAFKLIGGDPKIGVLKVDFTVPGAARYLPDPGLDAHGASAGEETKGKPVVKDFIQSSNFSARDGIPIDMVVLHCTAAETVGSTINWFLNPRSLVSAHYVIDTNGDIYQMVRDDCSAWHAKSANKRSIGIEHVGTGAIRMSAAQAAASAGLIRWLVASYGVPAANILGHQFAPGNEGTTACPGGLFGGAARDAIAKWVNAVLRGSNRPAGLIWGLPGDWVLKIRYDLSRIHQCVQRNPDKGPAALTPLEMMTIVLEDRRFFTHRGIDLPSVVREMTNLVRSKRHGGASTIDMQFVRTATGYRASTLKRKLYEALLAIAIQFRYDKREILRAYLACAFFGSGIIGADMAAQKIFQKDANELRLEEAALISAMLACPRPLRAPPAWESRVERRRRYAIHVYSSSKTAYSGPYEDSLRRKPASCA